MHYIGAAFIGLGHELPPKCLICAHLRSPAQRVIAFCRRLDIENQRVERVPQTSWQTGEPFCKERAFALDWLTANAEHPRAERSLRAAANLYPFKRFTTTDRPR